MFARRKIDDLNLAVVYGTAEQENLEVGRLGILIHAALGEIVAAIGFNIYG